MRICALLFNLANVLCFGDNMYKITTKESKQILSIHKTQLEAEEELLYITTKCDMYKKNELEIIKE
jgi:hypothetical protein